MFKKSILLATGLITLMVVTGCGKANVTPTNPTQQGTVPIDNSIKVNLGTNQPPAKIQGELKNVTINNLAFEPNKLEIKVGETVKWTNQDSVSHTVIGGPDWQSNPLNTGESFYYTFTQTGTYNYHCSIHPSMKGTITVSQ
ncbi:MAG: cupredoxin family copper-binding protein [Patescibacteria group bacterium]